MPKNTKTPEPGGDDLAFEDALSQLEDLVRDMESDQMPLEELIENYERGTNLYRVCEKRLDEAQGRIEIIRKNGTGETVVEPFDEGSGAETEEPQKESNSENESKEHGELF